MHLQNPKAGMVLTPLELYLNTEDTDAQREGDRSRDGVVVNRTIIDKARNLLLDQVAMYAGLNFR
jgi:hypothetical protein